jgi:hypothetical protein
MRVNHREAAYALGLVALIAFIALVSLAVAALGSPGVDFSTALAGVAAALGAAVTAQQARKDKDNEHVLAPIREHPEVPEREGSSRDGRALDERERGRRALRRQLTAEARDDCKVPPRNEYLCGRDDLVTEVVRRMRAALAADRIPVALLAGRPGVGTSNVAWAAARELTANFPGGVFRVDLRGLQSEIRRDTPAVVELVARAVNLHLDSELLSNDQRLKALRDRLDGRGVLLILDDARDAEHVASLVSPPIAAGIIVTSRSRSQNYVGRSLFFKVKPLTRGAAVKLLRMFAEGRLHSHGQLARLARLGAYLPLALCVIGRKIQSGPADLDTIIDELEKTKLDDVVRTAIRLSYNNLEDPSVQRIFRLLSATAARAGSPAEMAYITDEPGPHESRLLTLAERSLARRASAGNRDATYWLYDLVSDFAREELAKEQPETVIRHFERDSVTFLRDRLRQITTEAGPAGAADRLDPARYQAAEMLARDRGWPGLAADLADSLHLLFLDRGEEDTATAIHDRLVQQFVKVDSYAAASAACLTAAQRLDDRGATHSAVKAATNAAKIARDHELNADLARADEKLSYLLRKLDSLAASGLRVNGRREP